MVISHSSPYITYLFSISRSYISNGMSSFRNYHKPNEADDWEKPAWIYQGKSCHSNLITFPGFGWNGRQYQYLHFQMENLRKRSDLTILQ